MPMGALVPMGSVFLQELEVNFRKLHLPYSQMPIHKEPLSLQDLHLCLKVNFYEVSSKR